MQRVFRLVDVADLTAVNLKPSDKMVQSVRRHGVLSPVLLEEVVDDDGVISLEIVDGNRRVSAAKQVNIEKVPAVVYQDADPETMSAATVITNTLRSKNPLTEWQALESLGELGHDVKRIGSLTGLTANSYHIRMRPGGLPQALRDGLHNGTLFPTVAEAVGRLPADAQRDLARMFERKGWLSKADVDAMRKQVQGSEDSGPVPDVSDKPASQDQLIDQLAMLARYARSRGLGEYEWSKVTGEAWRRSSVADDGSSEVRDATPGYDDTDEPAEE